MKTYRISSFWNINLVEKKARLAIMLGDKVVKPLHTHWWWGFCIIMQRVAP